LAEAQARTEERLAQLSEEVRALVTWQRGEAGRREGERYEQQVVRRAVALFNGGQGGATDQLLVQQWLTEHLRPRLGEEILAAEDDPFLADLIWWKGEQVMVVEASLRVNGEDVRRAARRAAMVGGEQERVRGMVVGEEWVGTETRRQAEVLGVVWKVGEDRSDGFLTFRRLPS
jgi:hypothetical protein